MALLLTPPTLRGYNLIIRRWLPFAMAVVSGSLIATTPTQLQWYYFEQIGESYVIEDHLLILLSAAIPIGEISLRARMCVSIPIGYLLSSTPAYIKAGRKHSGCWIAGYTGFRYALLCHSYGGKEACVVPTPLFSSSWFPLCSFPRLPS